MTADRVEIAVLGKGVGESVVIGLAADEWVVVDSFLSGAPGERGNSPAPLSYLRSRGVDVARHVKAVVLTHVHSDHALGIHTVVAACRKATFYMPAAVSDATWGTVLQKLKPDAKAAVAVRHIRTAHRHAVQDERFRELGATQVVDTRHMELLAVGPTTRSRLDAREALDARDPRSASVLRRVNCTSIVLWLQAGRAIALLGADMDCHDRVGWNALLEEHSDKAWVAGATLVKAPHHGSVNAHQREVYDCWTDRPVVVVTPFTSSDLPRPEMVGELKAVARSVWLAGPRSPDLLGPEDDHTTDRAFAVVATCARTGAGEWDMSETPREHRL